MTGTRDPQQDGSIQAMLSDSGLETAAELRSALDQLRGLVPATAPAPRADLAALLAAGAAPAASSGTAQSSDAPSGPAAEAERGSEPAAGVVSLADRRRARNRRLAIVGGAVIGAMSLGAGAVAASSEDFRHDVSQTVGVIFQPAGQATPAPENVQPSPASIPAFPAPAASSPAGAGTSSASPTDAAPDGDKESDKRAGHKPRATPPAVGRDGILPTPGQRPVTPGPPAAPGLPGNGKGKGNGDDNGGRGR